MGIEGGGDKDQGSSFQEGISYKYTLTLCENIIYIFYLKKVTILHVIFVVYIFN